MASEKTFHMTPDEFRRHGHAVVDWIADYYTRIESFPVLSRAEPGQIRASLPADPPAKGEPFPAMLADIEKLILPGVTHWQSPNFYAYFPSNASGPAILGDLLSSGLGVQGMLWATSPACTELETHVLDWLVHMLDLPREISFHQQRRRSDPGHCFERFAMRPAGGAGAGDKFRQQRARLRWKAGGLHFVAGTLVAGKGRSDCRHRTGTPARDRSGREFRHAARRLWPARSSRTAAPG